MTKVNNNLYELTSLSAGLISRSRYGNDGFMFVGLVTYEAYSKIYTEILEVYLIIGGADPCMKLDIYEKGNTIKIKKFHLDFNPQFPNPIMKYDTTNKTLNIIGNSPKMGNYKLSVTEN